MSSNIEGIGEQTCKREIEPTKRGRGRKDKPLHVISNMKARLAKVELAMVDT